MPDDRLSLKSAHFRFGFPFESVVQYDAFDGKPYYQCGVCYTRSLTATANTTPMSYPPRTPYPAGTRCCTCEKVLP